jgi:hypothetical protein
MRLRKLQHTHHGDYLIGIAPIYKVNFSGEVRLIGTGFWVTERGHLVTAWHVIEDNIGKDGIDAGPIYAMCMSPDRTHTPRVLRKSYKHTTFDLALSETSDPDVSGEALTWPLPMTLDEPEVGAKVFTHAFVSQAQSFLKGKHMGLTTSKFNATLAIPDLGLAFDLAFMTRLETGHVRTIFAEARDSVMLPFPCFQSEMPVYSANSGGPVFDAKGRICGVNCSSYEGTDISFHIPTKGVLDLFAREIELIPEDPVPRGRTVLELGLAKRVLFDPPLAKVFLTFGQRLLLRPWHVLLDLVSWAHWFRAERRRRLGHVDDSPPTGSNP